MQRLQFSLRMLFVAVAIVAISAALWVAEPSWQVGAVEALLSVGVVASGIILAVRSTGKAKGWWIGVACWFTIWTGAYWLFCIQNPSQDSSAGGNLLLQTAFQFSGSFRILVSFLAFAPLLGLVGLTFQWLLNRLFPPPAPKD